MSGATGPSNSSLVCSNGPWNFSDYKVHVHYYPNRTGMHDAALETVVPEWCNYEKWKQQRASLVEGATGPQSYGPGHTGCPDFGGPSCPVCDEEQ